eukprot:EC717740.1.p4 GENE.EC717740.1~~EC717740.1.p4  ORF type:complete len:51 (-),score=1.37 EC717740.1:53-205(-)
MPLSERAAHVVGPGEGVLAGPAGPELCVGSLQSSAASRFKVPNPFQESNQ